MFRLRALILALISALTVFAVSPAQATPSAIERLGLYVVVSDLDASTSFYQALFETPPSIRAAGFVGFTVAGGLFALVSREAFAPRSSRGDNVVPYLRVADIDREFRRVRSIATEMLTDEIVEEGPIRLFRFADCDGNVIEFFALVAPPHD